MKISVVIPALNEEAGIGLVIDQIPKETLQGLGYQVEIIVVDNGSTDRTAEIAAAKGAIVIAQPLRGYGNAYKAGMDNATGDIVVTGDADMTYPFDHTQDLVEYLLANNLEFLNTNRLEKLNPGLVAHIHALGTIILTWMMNVFFKCPFRDSQSGMWIFRRYVWDAITVESSGMSFSQEIKIEAFTRGFRCAEVPIEYRPRVGESKLDTFQDGLKTMIQLFDKYFALKFSRKGKYPRQPANLPGSVQVKNILIVSHYYPPHVGGIEIVACNQAKQLTLSDYKVRVITSDIPGQEREDQDGIEIIRIKASNIFEKYGVPFPLFSPTFLLTIWSLMKDTDVVHIHDAFYMSSFFGSICAKIQKKPVVLTQHVSVINHPNRLVMMAQKLAYATYGRFIFKNSKYIYTLNDRVVEFLIKQNVDKEKILAIANGVDVEIFHPVDKTIKDALRRKFGLSPQDKIILFVGRFVPKKGFDEALAACDEEYKIVFVGGEKPAHQTKHNAVFLGRLDQPSLAEVYQTADIFLLPSRDEGFPLSIQEAMACGLPVITTYDTGYQRYNFDEKMIYFLDDPTEASIRSTIKLILQNNALRKEMSVYSKEYAFKYFSWTIITQELAATYEAVIKNQ